MNVFISVVSHGHGELINSLGSLGLLCNDFKVVIKSNKKGDDFFNLTKSGVVWIDEQYGLGFGHNNNLVFDYCRKKLGMEKDDKFIVINPDVVIDSESLNYLVCRMNAENVSLCSINLFKDENFSRYDNSIRKFPNLMDFFKSFLGFDNPSIIEKSKVLEKSTVDWAAGSFLAFQSSHYQSLGGFDEKYFMYCEDIDICFRSYNDGHPVIFYPDIKALHLARHENRKIFTKHFFWHVASIFRFSLTRLRITSPKTSL